MRRILIAVAFVLGLSAGAVSQRSNTFYVNQFEGSTVGQKITAAQNSCTVGYPCYIVIDADLALTTEGVLPAKCAQCVWEDFRAGAFPTTPDPLTLKTVNGVKNANLFAGADIGARINAAYADLPTFGGTILVPAAGACYPFTTPIVFNTVGKPARLIGQGNGPTCLNFTPTSGTAITVNHGQNQGAVIEGLRLLGAGGTSVGLKLGGNLGAFGTSVHDITIEGFGIGLTFSDNTWKVKVSNSLLWDSTQNLVYPAGLTNSGEQITFDQTFFADHGTSKFADNLYVYGPSGLSMQFINCGFDQVQTHLTGDGSSIGTVSIIASHFEVPNGAESRPFVVSENTNLFMSGDDTLNAFGTVQNYPITISGGGLSVVSAVRVQGGSSHAMIGLLTGAKVSIIGNLYNPTNPTVKPYEQVDATYAAVSVFGDFKFTNEFYSDKWFNFRSGTQAANNGVVSISGESNVGRLRFYRWTGAGTVFTPFQIGNLGANSGEIDFCEAPNVASPDLFGSETYTCNASILSGGKGQFKGGVQTPNMKSNTGTNFVCVDTTGNFVKSTTACSGT